MALQTAFYIIGIIFMGLMLIILVALTIAVLVIRAKIIAIERTISEKFYNVKDVADRAVDFFKATKNVVSRKAH